MSRAPSRRAALGLLACAALPLARAAPAAAQSLPSPFGAPAAAGTRLRFGAFAVDTERVAFLGAPERADLLAQALAQKLPQVFADLRERGGATLTARISSLYLPPWAGGRHGGQGNEGPDNIEGVGIVSSGGRILSQTPLLTSLEPSYSGPFYLPDIDRRRIDSIAYQFAYWLRREMGV